MNGTLAERVTKFDKGTPEELKVILERLRVAGRQHRIRVFLGDPDTGLDWNEENDVTGYVGRSTGSKPILLLIPNVRSLGGGALLTAHILKLIDISTGQVLYQHPKYHSALFVAAEGSDEAGYAAQVFKTTHGALVRTLYANCKTFASAYRLAAFMNGARHNK